MNPLYLPTLLLICMITLASLFLMGLSKKGRRLPGPPGLPVIGNLHQLSKLLHTSFDSLSRKHGPIFSIRIGRIPFAVISSSALAKEVMGAQDLAFASRPRSSITDRLGYDTCDIVFSPYGEYWRQAKMCSIQKLLSRSRVRSLGRVRREELPSLLSAIRASSSSSSAVNLSSLMLGVSNDIICRAVVGKKCFSDKAEFVRMLRELGACLHSIPMRDFVPCFAWLDRLSGLDARTATCAAKFDAFLESLLEDQSTILSDDTFLHHMQTASHRTRDSLKALINDMLVGGTDTISSMLEWVMAELVSHPSIMRRAQEEIRERFSESYLMSSLDDEAGDQMCYLKSVINETLRLHLPFPALVPRQTIRNSNIGGYDVPAGTRVFINAWSIARDEKYWKAPLEFWPDRFDKCESLSDRDNAVHDYHFIPFGAGRRACPAANFSYITIQYIVANLLYYFDWEIPEEHKEEVLDMGEVLDLNVHKKFPLILFAKEYLPCRRLRRSAAVEAVRESSMVPTGSKKCLRLWRRRGGEWPTEWRRDAGSTCGEGFMEVRRQRMQGGEATETPRLRRRVSRGRRGEVERMGRGFGR